MGMGRVRQKSSNQKKFHKGCLKKTVKFGTLAQKVGGGQASIPIFFHILIGTNTVGGRGSKGPCHKIIQ